MMDIFGLFIDCLLRPVFESDVKLICEDEDDEDDEEEERQQRQADAISNNDANHQVTTSQEDEDKTRELTSSRTRRKGFKAEQRPGDDMLDLEGPKLFDGCLGMIRYLQILGHINWLDQPLYLSIIYKIFILLILAYIYYNRFYKSFLDSNIIDQNYRNPIFLFISLLALISSLCHTLVGIYTNLFNLCPMFKILTTPKLCFIDVETQQIVGTRMLKFTTIFNLYNCVLCSMLRSRNLEEFCTTFQLHTFIIDSFALIVASYHLFGLTHFDFYIRSSFGFWLIAMKFNLEHRFTFLHKYQRKQRILEQRSLQVATPTRTGGQVETGQRDESQSSSSISGQMIRELSHANDSDLELHESDPIKSNQQARCQHQARPNSSKSQQQLEKEFKETYKFVTLDEIQKNLNNMDDHLEVWRSIQTSSLVVITLNAFLTNGALLLLVYNLIVNQDNYYHGFVLLLVAVNYTLIVFFCYFGDSWISYALSSFVQTVEDEYFLQGGDEPFEQAANNSKSTSGSNNNNYTSSGCRQQQQAMMVGLMDPMGARRFSLAKQHESLLIRKKDVLFCREFLHQFENHLATPWSKLTVKTHLHMLGTFVTLIAAQIIFDHEH